MRLRKKPWIEEAMKEVQGEYVFLHDIDKFKGHWQEMFPGKRLCLEIGCGKGRFTIGMAELYPDKAFIGVETQHDIAYFPAKAAKDKELTNVKIICANAENLLDWFEPGEIKELYLNFSDPCRRSSCQTPSDAPQLPGIVQAAVGRGRSPAL